MCGLFFLVFRFFFVLVREVSIRRVVVRRKQGFQLLLRAGVVAVCHKASSSVKRHSSASSAGRRRSNLSQYGQLSALSGVTRWQFVQ